MKMLGSNVLVTEIDAPTQTAGGIILSGAEIDKASKPAIVLSVSLEVANQGDLSVGNEVYLKWNEAMPVTIDGKKAAIINVDHIKAIIK